MGEIGRGKKETSRWGCFRARVWDPLEKGFRAKKGNIGPSVWKMGGLLGGELIGRRLVYEALLGGIFKDNSLNHQTPHRGGSGAPSGRLREKEANPFLLGVMNMGCKPLTNIISDKVKGKKATSPFWGKEKSTVEKISALEVCIEGERTAAVIKKRSNFLRNPLREGEPMRLGPQGNVFFRCRISPAGPPSRKKKGMERKMSRGGKVVLHPVGIQRKTAEEKNLELRH